MQRAPQRVPRGTFVLASVLLLASPALVSAQELTGTTDASAGTESPHDENAHALSTEEARPEVQLGFSPDEGAYVRTPDRAWSLHVGLLVQFRYQLSSTPDAAAESAFLVRVVRPQLRGTIIAPWIHFFVQPELAGPSPRLLDLQVDLTPHEAIGLRVGQFLTPFSRTFTTPVPRLLFPDFAQANDFFRADRDTGAMIYGKPLAGLLEYYVGIFNGNGIDRGGNDDEHMLYMARVVASPLGGVSLDETPQLGAHTPFRFSIGVNGYLGEVTRVDTEIDPITGMATTTRTLEENQTFGADLQVRWETFSLQAELYYRATHLEDRTERDALGGYAHAAWMFWWPWVEVAARVSVLDTNLATGADLQTVYEGMVSFYGLGNHLKLSLRYAAAIAEQASLVAAGVPLHSGTAQLQLQF